MIETCLKTEIGSMANDSVLRKIYTFRKLSYLVHCDQKSPLRHQLAGKLFDLILPCGHFLVGPLRSAVFRDLVEITLYQVNTLFSSQSTMITIGSCLSRTGKNVLGTAADLTRQGNAMQIAAHDGYRLVKIQSTLLQ